MPPRVFLEGIFLFGFGSTWICTLVFINIANLIYMLYIMGNFIKNSNQIPLVLGLNSSRIWSNSPPDNPPCPLVQFFKYLVCFKAAFDSLQRNLESNLPVYLVNSLPTWYFSLPDLGRFMRNLCEILSHFFPLSKTWDKFFIRLNEFIKK